MYPPGSTFKVITGATALEAKMVTPEERYLIMEGIGLLIKEILKERLWLGRFYDAMAKSDNVYFTRWDGA